MSYGIQQHMQSLCGKVLFVNDRLGISQSNCIVGEFNKLIVEAESLRRRILSSKLSDVLDAKQKENKVRNILTGMRKDGIIERAGGNQRTGFWVLTIDYRNPTG